MNSKTILKKTAVLTTILTLAITGCGNNGAQNQSDAATLDKTAAESQAQSENAEGAASDIAALEAEIAALKDALEKDLKDAGIDPSKVDMGANTKAPSTSQVAPAQKAPKTAAEALMQASKSSNYNEVLAAVDHSKGAVFNGENIPATADSLIEAINNVVSREEGHPDYWTAKKKLDIVETALQNPASKDSKVWAVIISAGMPMATAEVIKYASNNDDEQTVLKAVKVATESYSDLTQNNVLSPAIHFGDRIGSKDIMIALSKTSSLKIATLLLCGTTDKAFDEPTWIEIAKNLNASSTNWTQENKEYLFNHIASRESATDKVRETLAKLLSGETIVGAKENATYVAQAMRADDGNSSMKITYTLKQA